MVPSAQSQARGHGEGGGVQYQADTRSQNSRTWGCLALLMLYDRFGIFNLSEGTGMKILGRLFSAGGVCILSVKIRTNSWQFLCLDNKVKIGSFHLDQSV